MRTAHKWTVDVQSGAPGNEVTKIEVTGHWDPSHVLTNESVSAQGEFTVKRRNKFQFGAVAIPDSVELVS